MAPAADVDKLLRIRLREDTARTRGNADAVVRFDTEAVRRLRCQSRGSKGVGHANRLHGRQHLGDSGINAEPGSGIVVCDIFVSD